MLRHRVGRLRREGIHWLLLRLLLCLLLLRLLLLLLLLSRRFGRPVLESSSHRGAVCRLRRRARARAAGYGGLVEAASCRGYGARRIARRRMTRIAVPRPFPPEEAEGVHQRASTRWLTRMLSALLIGQARVQEGKTDEAVATKSCTVIKPRANEPMVARPRDLVQYCAPDVGGLGPEGTALFRVSF